MPSPIQLSAYYKLYIILFLFVLKLFLIKELIFPSRVICPVIFASPHSGLNQDCQLYLFWKLFLSLYLSLCTSPIYFQIEPF